MKYRLSSLVAPRPARGSAFVTVMMFTCVMFLLSASLIKWSMTERKLNLRNASWLEARNGAEAVAEYGFAQIVTQYNSYATPPSFAPNGSGALQAPGSSFFTGSSINTNAYNSSTQPYGLELIGGTSSTVPSTGSLYFIDPSNPDNQRDTLVGQWVYRRDVQVLARATAVPSTGRPITAYVTEKVSIRGAPLFAHAIFYSDNDMEVAPGPVLDVYGPVHVNGNMFPMAQGTVETGTANSVNFRGPVSVTGNLYHSWASEVTGAQGRGYESSGDGAGEPIGYDPVTFINTAGSQVNLKDSGGVWKDSTMGTSYTGSGGLWTDSKGRYSSTSSAALTQLESKLSTSFRAYAAQTWGGNVQTASHGVQAYHPISFTQPIDAAGTLPDPHAIIEAPDTTLTTADTYYSAKHEVETQKLSMQSGLYIEVKVTPGAAGAADTHTVTLYGPANSAPSGTASSDIGPNGGIKLGAAPAGLVTFVPFLGTAVGDSTYNGTKTTYSGVKYTSGPNNGKYAVTSVTTSGGTVTQSGGAVTMNGSGVLTGATSSTLSYSGGTAGSSVALGVMNSVPATSYTVSGSALTTSVTDTSSASVSSGMYDQRQGSGVNLVQLNMAALKSALADTNANSNADSKAILNAAGTVWGSGTWNGGVYVEVKSASGGAYPNKTGVVLANGKVTSGSSLLPTVNSIAGLTVATNAPVYILGNFNADGANASTGTSATTPDDGKTNAAGTATSAQIPVAIAADAITILSPDYFGTSASTNLVPSSNGSNRASTNWDLARTTANGPAEVAAAFITGIVATTSSGFSGGVHNLPRFLENWNGNAVAIRGSLVSLFKSKVATGGWAQRYYSAPPRVWGFDKTFQNGTFPPLTPRVMSYRRVDFTDLNASTYSTARHNLWPSLF